MRKFIRTLGNLTNKTDENFGQLENKLYSALDPVAPNPDFVKNLRYQLLSQWGTIPALPSSNTPIFLLMIIVIMFSGIMFIVVSVRLIFILGGILTLLNRWRNQPEGKQLGSARTV
ncbi:MAG: hypothetical protein JSV61_14610 [Anaerolineales bacterium]|nr:MAG: hypothetical protein JSV61_14610 [Anaerolineales bacterium]